jgi:hypothetical protein
LESWLAQQLLIIQISVIMLVMVQQMLITQISLVLSWAGATNAYNSNFLGNQAGINATNAMRQISLGQMLVI